MATVHPSRMGLVPQGNGDSSHRSRYRSRSRTPERKRTRSRSNSSGRERERGRDYYDGRRRHSPEYEEYSKETNNAPWHSQSNMYPERRGRRDNYNQTGGSDWFTHRQQLRDNKQVSIWPPSPKAPARSMSRSRSRSPRRKRTKKRSRRHDRSATPSSSETDSEEEERRRKEKRAHKRREREEHRESKRRRHHERRERTRSRSVEEESRRRRRSRTKTRTPSPESDDDRGEQWVEKPAANALTHLMAPSSTAELTTTIKNGTAAAAATVPQDDDDSDTELGPQPVFKASAKVDERSYGGSLLRGEGSAMAAFLADDTNARIPRRGEIGLASDQIAAFEAAGYVMSGSRHRRMNAVRLRKENQVISAEEKRGILKLQKEERSRREELLREEFKELMEDKLKVAGTKQPPPPQ